MKWAIVPREPDDDMRYAGVAANQERMVGDVWSAMLAAAPALTDADVDELCIAWWSTSRHWQEDRAAPRFELYRDKDRTRMRGFLAKIGDES